VGSRLLTNRVECAKTRILFFRPPAPKKAVRTYVQASKDRHAVTKRLQMEHMILMMRGAEKGHISFSWRVDNLFKWIGTIPGPSGTMFEGLTYKLSLEFTNSYPYHPPVVKLITPKCFHPNVDTARNIMPRHLKEKCVQPAFMTSEQFSSLCLENPT
jgi:ubiquitin-protein ligase